MDLQTLRKLGGISPTIDGISTRGCPASLGQSVSLLKGINIATHHHMESIHVSSYREKRVAIVVQLQKATTVVITTTITTAVVITRHESYYN